MLVAEAAPPAPGDDDRLVGGDVVEEFTGLVVVDEGPGGHLDGAVLAGVAVLLLAASRLARLGLPVADALEIDEGVEPRVGVEEDIAALAAVASVRAALGDVLAAVEGDAAVPALAGLDDNGDFVYEHAQTIGRAGLPRTRFADWV